MRRTLVLILVCFAALGVVYSVVVPLFEASDELWHYPMVKTIADRWELPVQDAVNVGPWRQEGSQPPLYYGLAAVLTFWVDTSDMDVVRRLNPHVDSGVSTPDGNINMVVHHPVRETFPWQGTALAVHLIRLVSVGMGVVSVYLAYRLVSELFPDRPELALGVAAVNAFTPMFVFVSGSVNNDSLVILLCTLALFLIAKTGNLGPEAYKTGLLTLALGVVLGLAALAKESALGLLPLTVLAVSVRAWYGYSEESVLRRFGLVFYYLSLVLLPASVIAGWWYWRNWRLHGDPLGWNLFLDIVGRRTVPADLAQLWSERHSFLAGYWGNFGGFNVPMPAWAYGVLNALGVLAGDAQLEALVGAGGDKDGGVFSL